MDIEIINKLKTTYPTMQLYCWCGTEIWAIDGNEAIRYDSDIGAWQGSCLNKVWVVDCCEEIK